MTEQSAPSFKLWLMLDTNRDLIIFQKKEEEKTRSEQLETIAQTKGYKILEARVIPDHIHLFIEADPFDSPTNIVKIFKGVTGLRMSRIGVTYPIE
jgi:REP element-mobilizing transposase RayT